MSALKIRNTRYAVRILYCVFLFSLLTACARIPVTPFIPPTREITPTAEVTSVVFATPTIPEATLEIPTETPVPEFTSTPEPPSPTPACFSNLQWLADLTYPDGSTVLPGQTVIKQWRIQNNGTCNWDERYRLKFASGDMLGALNSEVMLYPAASGAEAIIEIEFTAPQFPGLYRTTWQAYDPDGKPFGQALYMEIIVQ
jgi:hypothetical protein